MNEMKYKDDSDFNSLLTALKIVKVNQLSEECWRDLVDKGWGFHCCAPDHKSSVLNPSYFRLSITRDELMIFRGLEV